MAKALYGPIKYKLRRVYELIEIMFAFYIQESSFQWILIDEIEQVLSSINEIIINSNSFDTFYQYEDIISAILAIGALDP